MTRDLPQPVPPPDQTQIACTTTATKNADECMNKQNKGEKKNHKQKSVPCQKI